MRKRVGVGDFVDRRARDQATRTDQDFIGVELDTRDLAVARSHVGREVDNRSSGQGECGGIGQHNRRRCAHELVNRQNLHIGGGTAAAAVTNNRLNRVGPGNRWRVAKDVGSCGHGANRRSIGEEFDRGDVRARGDHRGRA